MGENVRMLRGFTPESLLRSTKLKSSEVNLFPGEAPE
jgi:hypothetical protein